MSVYSKTLMAALFSVFLLSGWQAQAKKCRAYLYTENGYQVGQYSNSKGCEEARSECLAEGRWKSPYGYCVDNRQPHKKHWVRGGGGGHRGCEVELYVGHRYVETFRSRDCYYAKDDCRDHVRRYYPWEYRHGRYTCETRHRR